MEMRNDSSSSAAAAHRGDRPPAEQRRSASSQAFLQLQHAFGARDHSGTRAAANQDEPVLVQRVGSSQLCRSLASAAASGSSHPRCGCMASRGARLPRRHAWRGTASAWRIQACGTTRTPPCRITRQGDRGAERSRGAGERVPSPDPRAEAGTISVLPCPGIRLGPPGLPRHCAGGWRDGERR